MDADFPTEELASTATAAALHTIDLKDSVAYGLIAEAEKLNKVINVKARNIFIHETFFPRYLKLRQGIYGISIKNCSILRGSQSYMNRL